MFDPDWAIDPDLEQYLTELFARYQPKTVVEFGSGASTVLMAGLLPLGGKLVSFEQSQYFGLKTKTELGIADNVSIVKTGITNGWYTSTTVPDNIDLVLVDGPGPCENRTRAPAMAAVYDSLAPQALIVVDDANREESAAAVGVWMRTYPDLFMRYIDSARGTYVLLRYA